MAKRKLSSEGMSKGLKIFLVVLGILGVGAGATAIATKGFKQWGEAEKLIKGGVTVGTFTIDSVSGTTATFIDKNDNELNFTFDLGEIEEKSEKFVLGDKSTSPNLSKADLEDGLDALGMSAKNIEKVEDQVLGLGYAKSSYLEAILNVEYEEKEADASAIELPWFDMVRINYKIDAGRYIVTSNSVDENAEAHHTKRTNTVTSLYENISLFGLKEDETLSENNICFTGFSLDAEKDNRITIESIELVRSTAGKHQSDLCWVTQA